MNIRIRSVLFLVVAFQFAGYSVADGTKDAKKSPEYSKGHPVNEKIDKWPDVEAAAKASAQTQEASMKSGSDTMKSGEKENNQVNPCNGDHPPSWC